MEWRNVFIAVILLVLLVFLPSIFLTVSSVVAEFSDAMRTAWSVGSRGYGYSGDPVQSVAKLAVLGIIVVGIVKILSKRR